MFDFIKRIRSRVDERGERSSQQRVISRAQFLRGDISGRRQPLRPPWAIDEYAFTETCTRCDHCIKRCPEGVLIAGAGKFPVVEFSRGECTFCGECVTHCEPQALCFEAEDKPGKPWDLEIRLGHSCIAQKGVVCQICGDQCLEQVFRFRPRVGGAVQMEMEADQCTGCGSCIAPCPVDALTLHPRQSEAVE
ncbi:MAG: ferredoxin-type protein NapF [Gammaproteobacteria bacterium]|jgi:ferredoxin-type protein NapF|nr:ferredoxin-type protein NapF [Gammaproteobacteria bacterium]MBT7307921.1 ferredoxin-type protein NapF [Gammaproteobacteria bacterium]